MAARLSALLPRLAALTLIWLLATSAVTFAAGGRTAGELPEPPAVEGPAEPSYLVVPDVRRQAYVFAKGILADGGFAWRVEGPVDGYAANTVVSQRPGPGTKLEDTGAPTIVLRLERNSAYPERGLPENRSPNEGTAVVLAGAPRSGEAEPPPGPAEEPPAEPEPAGEPDPPAEPEANEKPKEKPKQKANGEVADKPRKPAFVAKGAPPEPLDEMPLPERAKLVERRLVAHKKPTPALVNWWLYQHAWIVTGARFGWSGGAEALRILVRVDASLQKRWGIGGKSLAVARQALADVERHSR